MSDNTINPAAWYFVVADKLAVPTMTAAAVVAAVAAFKLFTI